MAIFKIKSREIYKSESKKSLGRSGKGKQSLRMQSRLTSNWWSSAVTVVLQPPQYDTISDLNIIVQTFGPHNNVPFQKTQIYKQGYEMNTSISYFTNISKLHLSHKNTQLSCSTTLEMHSSKVKNKCHARVICVSDGVSSFNIDWRRGFF